jgi:phage terminase large subunit GpA-like protein
MRGPSLADAKYADPRVAFARAIEALLPPARVDVADYAAGNRYLVNEGGGYVGRWRHDPVPYLVEPMRAWSARLYSTIAVAGPGQSAKTEIAQNVLLHDVATDPANLLWYMQTDDAVAAFVKGRINPMVEAHDGLKTRQGLRPVDDSLHYKRFRGMTVEFLSATSSNLINKSAPRIIADEIDAYPPGLGDVKALLDIRRQAFGRESRLLAISHPDRAEGLNPAKWSAGIMAIYADSDRRVWYWPCPHCGAWSSPNPWGLRVMTLDYPSEPEFTLDDVELAARLICPVNGCEIEDGERHQMNLAGRWIGRGQLIDEDGTVEGELAPSRTAGFWIVGAMSPFILGGIGGLARARVKAEREYEAGADDAAEATLRTVLAKQWGIPWSAPRQVGQVDGEQLAARAEAGLDLGQVPEGVRFLTLAIDCQIASFDWLVRGWGVQGESWVVDHGVLGGNPATDPEDWDRLFETVIARAWPLADGSGRGMTVHAAGYDYHGAPGVSSQGLDAWTRWRRLDRVKSFGKISGRDAWAILPTRGIGRPNAPRLAVTYPDTSARRDRRASKGTVPVAQFNANAFKDDLAGQLQRAIPGPWFVHFPGPLRRPRPPHLFFDQLAAENRDPAGRWIKANHAARNEALDQLVMSHVIAHLHGLSRIVWGNPPTWAEVFDKNCDVIAAPSAEADTAAMPADLFAAAAAQPARPRPWLEARRNWLR